MLTSTRRPLLFTLYVMKQQHSGMYFIPGNTQ